MLRDNKITELARKYNEYVIACRRTIHKMPETSGNEVKTSAFIRSEIEKAGLPVEGVGDTGLIATLDTGKPGPHIALRADIDALPVEENENNLAGKRVCISAHPGFSHACGHDAHSAMLLGSMKALIDAKDDLCGVIYFCFEEGEEDGRGVPFMIEALSKRKVDTVWAIHVYAGLDSGKICVSPGARMAGAAEVLVKVNGKGGHGSRPDMAANPVFCAAAILTNVATVWVNQIKAGETVTLGVTTIKGGEALNVIPETATIGGSLRFFSKEEGHHGVEIFKSVAEHTAAMNNCSVEFGKRFDVICDPVINDEHYSAIAEKGLTEILSKGAVAKCDPWYASEAFSVYCRNYPCVFAFLGINNPEYGSGAPHHNTYFDVDENVLETGLISTLKYVAEVEAQA